MSTKLILFIALSLIAFKKAEAGDDFYRWFPSCKVYLQEHCDQQAVSIGSRMDCYRNFLENSKICQRKTAETIAYGEKKNREMEGQGKAKIKAEASEILESNYTKFSGLKIDEHDSRSIERIEAQKQLRNFISFINRIMIPGIKEASPKVIDLISKTQELNQLRMVENLSYKQKLSDFIKSHDDVFARIKSLTSTYELYVEFFRPRFEGLKHEQNRNDYVEIMEKSRLLVQEAFDMESSLLSLLESVNSLNVKNDLKMNKSRGVTKGELALQKLFQTRMKLKISSTKDQAELIGELEFYQKLCRHAYPQNPTICDSEQGL